MGFLALFGIATDDWVLMAIYLDESKARLKDKGERTRQDIRDMVLHGAAHPPGPDDLGHHPRPDPGTHLGRTQLGHHGAYGYSLLRQHGLEEGRVKVW